MGSFPETYNDPFSLWKKEIQTGTKEYFLTIRAVS